MDRLSLCIVGFGLLGGIMTMVQDYLFLRPAYLPNRSERELRMARWRGVGSSVGGVLVTLSLALFFQDPHQTLYLRLLGVLCPVVGVLSVMDLSLRSEARKARRERKGGASS